MLKVEKITWEEGVDVSKLSPQELLEVDVSVTLEVSAPLYWWFSIDGLYPEEIYRLITSDTEIKFSFDSWFGDEKICNLLANAVNQAVVEETINRALEILPMGTMLTGGILTSYRELVYTLVDYKSGLHSHTLPLEREWRDYYETIADIKGINDLAEEEVNE